MAAQEIKVCLTVLYMTKGSFPDARQPLAVLSNRFLTCPELRLPFYCR